VLREGQDFLLIAVGSMVEPAQDAAGILEEEGLTGTVINARFIKPLDKKLLRSYAAKTKLIFTAEEGIIEGGFGSAVSEAIDKPVEHIGLPCEFIPHGKRDILLQKYGLTKENIASRIKEALKE
jgi:1-deoxy-D-xylulose-5-phosphate synthase